jgi:hypothetical protein
MQTSDGSSYVIPAGGGCFITTALVNPTAPLSVLKKEVCDEGSKSEEDVQSCALLCSHCGGTQLSNATYHEEGLLTAESCAQATGKCGIASEQSCHTKQFTNPEFIIIHPLSLHVYSILCAEKEQRTQV